jgi:hypothetical protein
MHEALRGWIVDKSSEGICRLDDKVRTSRKPRDNEIQINLEIVGHNKINYHKKQVKRKTRA